MALENTTSKKPKPMKEIHTFEAFRALCESQRFHPRTIAILAERIGFLWMGQDVEGHNAATLLDAMEKHHRAYWEGRAKDDEKPLFLEL
jgi:hypothetical protein